MRAFLLSLALASSGAAEDLPDFAACIDREAARFERLLAGIAEAENPLPIFEVADVRGVGYCGSLGIVNCDRSLDFFGCQRGLRVRQDVLTQKVLMSLPEPEDVQGDSEAAAFYPQLWALAQGSSAGPDCAGDLPQRQVWCEAWEANNRLSNAVLAWQVARFLGVAEPAVAAGWARNPPLRRPRARKPR